MIGGSAPSSGGGSSAPGDRVEAQFGGRGKSYPATVKKDNGDGTYALEYDDGDKEDAAKAEHIKAMGGGSAPASGGSSFAPGDRVEAQFGGRGKSYPATVKKDNADGTFALEYDDGDKEDAAKAEHIKAMGGGEHLRAAAGSFAPGDRVEAQFGGRGKSYPATVKKDNGDGTFALEYDDGDKEDAAKAEHIKAMGGGSAPASGSSAPASGGSTFKPGDRVEAQFNGRGKSYPATVKKDNGDGTFALEYDDGDKEDAAKAEHMHAVSVAPEGGGTAPRRPGAAARARRRRPTRRRPARRTC